MHGCERNKTRGMFGASEMETEVLTVGFPVDSESGSPDRGCGCERWRLRRTARLSLLLVNHGFFGAMLVVVLTGLDGGRMVVRRLTSRSDEFEGDLVRSVCLGVVVDGDFCGGKRDLVKVVYEDGV